MKRISDICLWIARLAIPVFLLYVFAVRGDEMKCWRALPVTALIFWASLIIGIWTRTIAARQGEEWEIIIPPEEQQEDALPPDR